MKQICVALIAFLLMGASSGHEDERLTFVGFNMPPFYMRPDATGISGAGYEIMQQLCEREKMACRFTILPFSETIQRISDGKFAMGGPMAKTEEREKIFYFSTPVFHTSLAFFGLDKHTKKIHQYEDLKGKKVGVTNPSISMIALNEINDGLGGKIKIVKERDTLIALKMADLGTYQLAYVNADNGRYWVKRYRSKMKEVPHLTKNVDFHFVFSRKTFSEKEFVQIDTQLKKMLEEKVVEKIAVKYGLHAAEAPTDLETKQ
ncbi:transporter substrate-binding domain-containing protein [Bdellovibrio sp. SKB1291214]|uniref:substrate-binding periplasmic protein n=1 Tax=Bdellovibrio sp. SKB1291214 TaxID=1732569 RepID=UPI000B51BEB2|nr:transporter substrate-binding domain-containing protein [Bdellovibrio sp. SKB1291214]UYL09098.1 transporter substrate-binding domain-containing protein [Bdellovibrio sp. SKB1291214]